MQLLFYVLIIIFFILSLIECRIADQNGDDHRGKPFLMPVLAGIYISGRVKEGDKDPVGDYGEAVKRICHIYKDELQLEDVAMRLYAGKRHEPIHEPEHADFFHDVTAWIESRISRAGK